MTRRRHPTLRFDERYVAPVLRENKTATVRLDGPDLQVGDRVTAETDTGIEFATLEIRGVATCEVFDVPAVLEVYRAAYNAETPIEVRDGLQAHYSEPVTLSTDVDVYVFDPECRPAAPRGARDEEVPGVPRPPADRAVREMRPLPGGSSRAGAGVDRRRRRRRRAGRGR